MLEKVYSGLPYFYNWGETSQGIISCHIRLKEKLDCMILEEAVNEALLIHRHFKVRMVVENNNVYYEDNENRARVVEGLDEEFALIRDTDDYLFSFRVVDDVIYLDVFHMLTDGEGVVAFCKTVALLYFSKVHKEDVDWNTLIEKRIRIYTDDRQKTDPYTVDRVVNHTRKSVDGSISECLQLYKEGDTGKYVNIKWNHEEYCKKSPVGVFSPYIVINVLLGNIMEERNYGEGQIEAYMPINMRKRVGTKDSMFNCLSYTNVKHVAGQGFESLYEQCRKYADGLKVQYGVEKSLDIMSEDAKFIEILQNEKLSIARKCGIVRGMNRRTQNIRGTFGMSYIQFCKEEDIYRRYVSELIVCLPNSNMGIVCGMMLFGNDVNLCIRYGDSQKEIVDELIRRLNVFDMGISVREVADLNTKIAIDLVR